MENNNIKQTLNPMLKNPQKSNNITPVYKPKKQYAISLNDCMSTYGINVRQNGQYIELSTGIINAETEKGARYLETIYVDNNPAIFVFEK